MAKDIQNNQPLVEEEKDASMHGSASQEARKIEEEMGVQDENQVGAEQIEDILDTDEVVAAEDAAVNTDNDTALQANAPEVGEEDSSKKAKAPAREQVKEGLSKHRSAKYKNAVSKVDAKKKYSLEEAVDLSKEVSFTKFDGSIELHVVLKQGQKGAADSIRGLLQLPSGAVKLPKVAILDEDLIAKIAKEKKTEHDILIAPKSLMPKIAQIAKVLGPQGKMPSPKAGTVVDNPEEVLEKIQSGRVEYRADKQNIIHMAIGKVSWDSAKILENAKAIIGVVPRAKITSISLAPTMGPSVKVDLNSI